MCENWDFPRLELPRARPKISPHAKIQAWVGSTSLSNQLCTYKHIYILLIALYVCICICVYICLYVQNWLKKLEDPQGWFLACGDIFGLARTSSSLGKNFTHLTELWRNCHIFESVKNHINAYISHPIRDRNVKT